MAGTIAVKLYELLKGIGVDVSQQQASNVKKLYPKNKSTSTKVGLLAAERDTGGNFATVLDIFKNDAKYISTMNDVEQMNFLNNIMDYKEFGGSSIKNTEGIRALDEAKNLTNESSDLKTSIDELTNKAKSMKDEAELNVNKAYKDLDDFFETGGDPFKKKDDKFLGGSMSEEGQVRTGIRQFLQKEYKNGRINLDKKDIERVMKYSGLSEDDPILVFKKLYGDEAYKKAGSFPGAFDIGENYNQYEEIFRKNMGEDTLKVKDKKYVGDGKLILTESEEVFTPSKFDDDIPFATGGRASFAGGKFIDEIVLMITKKEPMDAMKEVNKIIGKKGKYKNLTQEDIDRIVNQTEDHIFQRDPDNLFVEDRPMFKKETDEVDLSQGMIDLDELNFTSNAKAAKEAIDNTSDADLLMKKYPGMDKNLAEQIATEGNPRKKADIIAMVEQTFKMSEQGMSGDDIIQAFKNTPRTKQADGGITQLRNGYYGGGRIGFFGGKSFSLLLEKFFKSKPKKLETVKDFVDKRNFMKNIVGNTEKNKKARQLADIRKAVEEARKNPGFEFKDIDVDKEIRYIFDQSKDRTLNSTGGRAGYYGGGAAMVGEDLSEIGHGSDSLMARNMQLAPNSMATTSTGLNYLLGEDNDTVRVPYNKGNMVLPKSKPAQSPLVELSRIYKTYEEAMPGVSKDTQQYLQQDFIQKLNDAGISQEDFMTYRMQNNLADGGRIGFRDGLNFKKYYDKKSEKAIEKMLEKETQVDKNLYEEGQKKLNKKSFDISKILYETKPTRDKFKSGLAGDKEYELALTKYNETSKGKKEQENEMFKMVEEFKTLKKRGILRQNETFKNFQKMKEQSLVNNKILELDIKYPEKEIIDKETGVLNKKNLKKAIDAAVIDLEITPIDGLTLKRSLNTEGKQSVTGGSFDFNNLNFSSDNIEEGRLTSKGNFTFGDVDLSGMVNSNDGEILDTELGFNYDNALKGKATESDGYKKTEFDLNKKFTLPSELTEYKATSDGYNMISPKIKNLKLRNVIDNLDLGIGGNYDITSSNGQTYRNSDLTPKLSYNDGILSADISKEILEGGKLPNFNLGVKKNGFYAKGNDLLSEDRDGVFGYEKTMGDKDGDFFFTGGAEKNLVDGDYTIGAGLKYKFADGGIAGLRKGYAGGKGVDIARRGFLKILGGSVAAATAFKMGLVKMLGKESGAVSKKAVDEFFASGTSGAPTWFEPLVNKALKEGLDITEKAAIKDGQIVKQLDTPTGKVDVTYDTRTGAVDVDYMGSDTALGDGLQMRYAPGEIIEEGAKKGEKSDDVFEAVESVPEMQGYNEYDVELAFGENLSSNVDDLYSNTSELKKLGGEKLLIKDISNTLKKKKVLKEMDTDPQTFATDLMDQTGVPADPPHDFLTSIKYHSE